MNKRTTIDFSRHEVKVTQFEGVLIHEFKRPDTRNCMLVFINTQGVMTVTGDFGNWVFCREFHPSPEGSVSAGYWDEKLRIASEQDSHAFCSQQTEIELKEFRDNYEDNYGEMTEEVSEWLENLEGYADDEFEYTYYAYRETPRDIDAESVPFGKARHSWLNCVYDGFDALCLKLKENEI